MEKVCRLCLREYFDLTSVFLIKQGRRVTNMIKDVVPEIRIERDDNHSKLICSECLEVVCSAFELRTVSIKNAKRMGSLVDSPRGSYMSGGSKEAGRSAPQSEPCRTNVGNVIATKAQTTIRRNFQIKPLSIILKRVDVDFDGVSKYFQRECSPTGTRRNFDGAEACLLLLQSRLQRTVGAVKSHQK